MTIYLDDTDRWPTTFPPPTQSNSTPADVSVEDAGLDPGYVTNLLHRDANPSDVIDRAIIVPLPDDDRDIDTDLY